MGPYWKRLLAAGVACTMLSAAAPAAAQNSGSNSGGVFAGTAAALGISTFTSISAPIATTVGGAVTIVTSAFDLSGDIFSKREFLRRNATALQRELTVGTGESLRMLAVAMGVDARDYETFFRVVHARRAALVPLTDRTRLTDERARRFFEVVARAMRGTPALRDDLAGSETRR